MSEAMSDERVKPADCRTMEEVRHGVDRLDEAIVALVAERFRYMDAAARIKPERGHVRDEARKAQVIGNVVRIAAAEGAPAPALAEVYERLVEASIAYELDRFDAARAPR
ncbi:MAG: isochorismate pyruvate lyase [Frankiaceae bacterium]|jgi:isochorismate pyruvate lyase|nr:isochorismate pyruvate lyase [Frankiaceae bacterium]